jgi:hypothetical protein
MARKKAGCRICSSGERKKTSFGGDREIFSRRAKASREGVSPRRAKISTHTSSGPVSRTTRPSRSLRSAAYLKRPGRRRFSINAFASENPSPGAGRRTNAAEPPVAVGPLGPEARRCPLRRSTAANRPKAEARAVLNEIPPTRRVRRTSVKAKRGSCRPRLPRREAESLPRAAVSPQHRIVGVDVEMGEAPCVHFQDAGRRRGP